jgi:hypothetical protein
MGEMRAEFWWGIMKEIHRFDDPRVRLRDNIQTDRKTYAASLLSGFIGSKKRRKMGFCK